jgi:hypothetical protein
MIIASTQQATTVLGLQNLARLSKKDSTNYSTRDSLNLQEVFSDFFLGEESVRTANT